MKLKSLCSVLVFLASTISAEKARFDFYRLYEISVDNEVQLNLMKQILEYPDGVKFFIINFNLTYNLVFPLVSIF